MVRSVCGRDSYECATVWADYCTKLCLTVLILCVVFLVWDYSITTDGQCQECQGSIELMNSPNESDSGADNSTAHH